MLHIVWILIKFILMFLAILLGLVVLVLLLILFCPIRYQASAAKEVGSFFDASADMNFEYWESPYSDYCIILENARRKGREQPVSLRPTDRHLCQEIP